MKHLRFYFDVVSPYAYLAFERLPQALVGLSVEVSYQPVLFAGLLEHWGNLGPAEIEPKRTWTYRQVAWLAHRQGLRLDLPAQHPFNPLALLRLALACVPEAGAGARLVTPSRRVCERLFHHVWHGGADPNDEARLAALTVALQPARDPHGEIVRRALREATTSAAERGIFGVPTIEVDDRIFWGLDSIEMLDACLRGDAWFDAESWHAAGIARPGVRRARST